MTNYQGYAKEIDGEFVFDNKRELSSYLEQNRNKKFVITIKRETGVRSGTQNSALHLYFTLIAEALNLGGYTVQIVLKEKVELDWDSDKVKELLWRPAQQAILKKDSTTQLSKIEDIDNVYEHLNRHLSEKFGIHIPFPSLTNK